VLNRERLPSSRLRRMGESLWQVYRAGESSRAYWLDEKAGKDLPERAEAPAPDPRAAKPLEILRRREGAFRVNVDSQRPGWLFVAEPLGPGWRVQAGLEPLSPVPALTAFAKFRLPAGRSVVDFAYRPGSWRVGLSVTLLFLCALAAYWYNRWSRRFEEFPRRRPLPALDEDQGRRSARPTRRPAGGAARPGARVALAHPRNFGDLYAYHLPLRHFAASRLMAGQMPFWNPCILSGLPFLANPQAALFYPPSVVFDVLSAGYAFTLNAAFHLALAALGMQLFLRRARLDAAGAFLLTASFTLSPMLIYRIPQGIPTQLAALSWVPWTWLALLSGRPFLLAGAWALQLLAGHPQYAAVNAVGLAVFALFDLRARGPVFAKAAGLAAALACLQLVLTAEFLGASNRVGWPPALAGAYSLPPRSLAALVLPGAFGNPLDGSYLGPPSTFFEFQGVTVGWAAALLSRSRLDPPAQTSGIRGCPLAAGRARRLCRPRGSQPPAPAARALARLRPAEGAGPVRPAPLLGPAPRRSGHGSEAAVHADPAPLGQGAALAVVFADLGPWAARFVYAEDSGPFLSRNEAFARQLAGRADRFITDPELANPNKAMLYRAMNANGYEAFY